MLLSILSTLILYLYCFIFFVLLEAWDTMDSGQLSYSYLQSSVCNLEQLKNNLNYMPFLKVIN